MPNVEVFINAKNKPGNLSDDPGAIVELVRQARIKPVNPDLNKQRGVPLIDTTRSNVPYAWVKYGTSIRRGEARTQQFVAEIVNSDSGYAVRVPVVYLAFQWDDYVFIAMEYIQGSICNDSDVPLVASAIRAMIQIKAPTAEPGPQGGGLIEHPFFVEKTASVTYKSVDLLEQHVNGVSVPFFYYTSPDIRIMTFSADLRVQAHETHCRFQGRGQASGHASLPQRHG